jgi:hypothetical protein
MPLKKKKIYYRKRPLTTLVVSSLVHSGEIILEKTIKVSKKKIRKIRQQFFNSLRI